MKDFTDWIVPAIQAAILSVLGYVAKVIIKIQERQTKTETELKQNKELCDERHADAKERMDRIQHDEGRRRR